MQKLMINETFLDTEADSYMTRRETNAVVIHHTGTLEDADVSADEIDCAHKGLGWTGIGYHYVIRKDNLQFAVYTKGERTEQEKEAAPTAP